MKRKVGILDLNISNVESINSAVKLLGYEVESFNIDQNFDKYSKIIIPGCGSFPSAIKNFKKNNIKNKFNNYLKNKSVLGICLGLQIFTKSSEEFNKSKGLGILNKKVIKLNFLEKLPNVGFRKIIIKKKNFLFEKISNNSEFYFMHSFGILGTSKKDFSSCLKYQKKEIITSISQNNFHGVQFHPEKSGDNGLKYLNNFLK